MSHATLEVADIIRSAATVSGKSTDRILPGLIARCSMRSCDAALRLWVDIATSVSAADIRPFLTTRAATGTARSARGTLVQGGFRRAPESCCRFPTSTSSSLFPMNSPLWLLGNKRLLHDLLYSTSSEAMLEMAPDPRHLGADIALKPTRTQETQQRRL